MTRSPFDLDAYLARIECEGVHSADLAALGKLHLAHLAHIPFENLDVRLGRRVGLDLESLQAKLVRARRGGYCFEQNALFAAALRSLGFDVATLEARVRPPGAIEPLPRTHMVLEVRVEGTAWLADVGFGGDGPLLPVPLDGSPHEQPDTAYRIDREGEAVHVLRRRSKDAWVDLYAFTLSPALPIDYEVAHHFTSTYPKSPFVTTLTVQRSDPEKRRFLRGRTYTVRMGSEETVRELSDDELPRLVRGELRLPVPDEDVLLATRSVGP